MTGKVERIGIIGAGPAGMAAAIQLSRQGFQPLLLEKKRPGGLLHNAHEVENYPGFPEGISGPRLVEKMIKQLRRVGGKVTFARVDKLAYQDNCFQLITAEGSYSVERVVVASGTKPRRYRDVPGSEQAADRIYYEVVDLKEAVDKTILILGGGDAAFDYALNLADQNRVIILNRGEDIKALKLLQERVKDHPRVVYFDRHRVAAVETEPTGGINLIVHQGGQSKIISGDYLLAAIGRQPDLDFLSFEGETLKMRLEQEGKLFFIGDVKNKRFRQTAIAVGDGLRAAMEIESRLGGGN